MSVTRIFGGATKPAMFLGVPILPFVFITLITTGVAGTFLIFVHWLLAAALAIVYGVVFFWMRAISRRDAWRLHQSLLRLRKRMGTAVSPIWGGVTYAPYRTRRRT